MTKLLTYTAKGKKSGTVDLPTKFSSKENSDLLTQALHVYEDRSHKGTSKVQTRSEVNATTAKMYRQKGTGNARHGNRRAPIFKGGGVAHGPKGVKRILNLSGELKSRALKVALNLKGGDGKMVVVDKLGSIAKTNEAQTLVTEIGKDLGIKRMVNVMVVLEKGKKQTIRFFKNIKGLNATYWRKVNAADIFHSNLVILDKDALQETKSDNKQNNPKLSQKLAVEAKISKPKIVKKLANKKTTKAQKGQKTVTKKEVSKNAANKAKKVNKK